jgi:hypothetical protein
LPPILSPDLALCLVHGKLYKHFKEIVLH